MGKKSKTKKVVLGCLSVFIIIILLLVGTVLYVLGSIFDDKPAAVVIKVPDVEALESATTKLAKTIGGESFLSGDTNIENLDLESLGLGNIDAGNIDLNNLENLDLSELMKKIDLGKVTEALAKPGKLTLTKVEVNALISTGFTADKYGDFQDPSKPKIYDAWFENGRFTIKMSLDTKFPTPFGSYCNIELVFIPQVIDHHLKLDLCSAKAGDFSFPVSYMKDTIDKNLFIYEQSGDGKQLLRIIDSLVVEDEKVVLKYSFQELSLYLIDKQDKLKILNHSDEVSTEELLKFFK